METDVKDIADAWVEYTLLARELGGYDEIPDEVYRRGIRLDGLVRYEPLLAVDAITEVTQRFSEADLASNERTDAQYVLDNLGAGPLEDLLAKNDEQCVQAVEAKAAQDGRFRWALGCCWQNAMSDDVWLRVQRASARSIY